MASRLPNLKSYSGLSILEVGSGRGGGLNFLTETLQPDHATGIDLSPGNIRFSRKRFRRTGNLEYVEGSADELTAVVEELEFDLVLNIESSHCFPRMSDFFSQVKLVLKKDGLLLLADMGSNERFLNIETLASQAGFKIVKKVNISPNVMAAMKFENGWKERVLNELPECKFFA